MAEIDLNLALAGAHSVRDLDRSWLTQGVVLGARGSIALEEIQVSAPEAGRGARAHRGDRRLPQRPARDRGGRLGSPVSRAARPRGRGHDRGGRRRRRRASRPATASCSAGRPPAARAPRACAARRGSASGRRCGRAACFAQDGSVLTPVLRAGTFATHTVVPAGRRGEGAARAAGRAGVPDRLRCRDRRHVGARDGEGVGGRARRGDRLRRRRAVGDPGRAHRRRVRDPRDRPRRAQARAGDAVRRHRTPSRGRSTSSSTSSRRRSTFEQGARPARLGRHVRPDRPVAGAARRSSSTCRGCSPSGRRSSSRTAATTCRRRTSRGSRSGRSRASSTSPAWSRAPAPLEGWSDALEAMKGGDVIRTVLLP